MSTLSSLRRRRLAAIGGVAPPPVSDPSFTSVDALGWFGDYTTPPAEFDPVGDAKYVYAIRPGFDASGNSTTVTDQLEIMKRVREPYPNENTLTANDVALSDFVFSGDTITGVTNNSTVAYHKPICMWLNHDLARVYDQTYTAKLAVAHWAARSGRPVAAVKFSATDGVTTVSQTVSTMTKTDYSASGLSAPHFEASLDFSTLADDTLITIDAVIYPWVGSSSFTASVDFAAYPSINFCEMKVFNAVTAAEAPIYAYVDGVGAGSPQVSTVEATAQANPFADVDAASSAIQALDGSNVSRGEVVIEAGATIDHGDFSARAVGDTPMRLRGANQVTSVYQDDGANSDDSICDLLKIENLTLRRNGSGNIRMLDSNASGSANMLVLEDVITDDNGQGAYGAFVLRVGRCWAINCSGSDVGLLSRAVDQNKMVNAIGCHVPWGVRPVVYNSAASRDLSCTYTHGSLYGTTREDPSGHFLGFNYLSNNSAAEGVIDVDTPIGPAGMALVGSVLEKQVVGSVGVLKISGDGDTDPAQNVVLDMNTVVGQRTNVLYNDELPPSAKYGRSRFSVFQKINTKSDVFNHPSEGPDGTRVENWSVIYKAGWRSNAYLQGDSKGSDGPGIGHWIGEVFALGDAAGTVADPLNADWLDDQSSDGGGAGGGDYRPGASSELPFIPSGLAPYPFDQNGASVANDGSARIGAVR